MMSNRLESVRFIFHIVSSPLDSLPPKVSDCNASQHLAVFWDREVLMKMILWRDYTNQSFKSDKMDLVAQRGRTFRVSVVHSSRHLVTWKTQRQYRPMIKEGATEITMSIWFQILRISIHHQEIPTDIQSHAAKPAKPFRTSNGLRSGRSAPRSCVSKRRMGSCHS